MNKTILASLLVSALAAGPAFANSEAPADGAAPAAPVAKKKAKHAKKKGHGKEGCGANGCEGHKKEGEKPAETPAE
jgi:hypothetical protein